MLTDFHVLALSCTGRHRDILIHAVLCWQVLWYTVTCCIVLVDTVSYWHIFFILIGTLIYCYVSCYTDRFCDILIRAVLYILCTDTYCILLTHTVTDWYMLCYIGTCHVILIRTWLADTRTCCVIHAVLYWWILYSSDTCFVTLTDAVIYWCILCYIYCDINIHAVLYW
jgi:hypothetical protein